MIKEETQRTYDRIAKTWDSKVWVKNIEFNTELIEFANISGDEVALDVGIGKGDFENFLKIKNLTGVDISKEMIAECKRTHPSFKLVVGDGENLPFLDKSFDLVLCRNLLQNFVNPDKAFREMHRVLKTGGKMLVIEGAVFENEREFVASIVRVTEPHHPLFPSHELIRALFEQFGIIVTEQRVGKLHKKWLSGFCESKQASAKQKDEIISICMNLPEWYREKYKMTFHSDQNEIESTLTFCFIRGKK